MLRIASIIVGVLLLLTFPVTAYAGDTYFATVTRISDGDTFTVETAGHRAGRFKVRVYGIDCPEIEQPQGKEAKIFVTEMLPLGGMVELRNVDIDRYGRTVAIVILPDGSTLQERLLENGLAWVYDRYCTLPECESWRRDEEEARRDGAGLWKNPGAIPPWKWRKGVRF